MNFLKSIVWPTIKGSLKPWLETRALVLPSSKVDEIARRFGVPSETIRAVNAAVIVEALGALDAFKP